MDQEYPFRPRGRNGFDREDVINYITQAQQRCNEHLADMAELEVARNAWYTQAKSLESEKATLTARNRELEEQLERLAANPEQGDGLQREAGEFALTAPEAAEFAALKAQVEQLQQQLGEEQNARKHCEQALTEALANSENLQQEMEALQQALSAVPCPEGNNNEENALRAQLDEKAKQAQTAQANIAALQAQVTALEAEKAAYSASLPALQEQLANLDETAERISLLESEKTTLAQELDTAKTQLNATAQMLESAAQAEQQKLTQATEQVCALEAKLSAVQAEFVEASEQLASLKAAKQELGTAKADLEIARKNLADTRREKDAIAKQAETQLAQLMESRRQLKSFTAECETLRARLDELELERKTAANREDTVRSMVLSSFNYANLYVDNNLKTAELISEATSRNIGHVNDAACSLLEQMEAISRSFGETTSAIRHNLTAFQHELSTIQSGMNRRLSKDRFQVLLEENDKLRESLETEILAELSADDRPPITELPAPLKHSQPLPFAEDLPQSYHAFLEE